MIAVLDLISAPAQNGLLITPGDAQYIIAPYHNPSHRWNPTINLDLKDYYIKNSVNRDQLLSSAASTVSRRGLRIQTQDKLKVRQAGRIRHKL